MPETGKRMEMGTGMVSQGDAVPYEPPGRDFYHVLNPAGTLHEDYLVITSDDSGRENYAIIEE